MLVILSLFGSQGFAAACDAIFPDGASNTTDYGAINISLGSQVLNSPDGLLASRNVQTQWWQWLFGWSCGTSICSPTNQPASTGTPVTAFPHGGANINVPTRQSRTIQPGNYRRVSVGREATLRLLSGTYVISDRFDVSDSANVEFEFGGTTMIYVGADIEISNARVNVPDNAQVLLYSASDIRLQVGAEVNAALYAEDNVTLQNDAVLTGAVSAGGTIALEGGSRIYFDDTVADGGFGSFCQDESSGPTLGGFIIDVGAGTGSTCSGAEVRIDVLDAGGQLFTGYSGPIALSTLTGHGTWQKTSDPTDALGTLFSGGTDSGTATYQFAADGADQGRITLQLTNERKELLSVTVAEDEVTATSAPLSFEDNVIEVVETDSLVDDVIAGRPHQYRLRMIKRDPVTGSCGPAEGYNLAQIKAWYSTAAEDPGGAAPLLINSGGTHSVTLPSGAPGGANFQANFVNGVTDVTLRPSDVGHYGLLFRDDTTDFADTSITGGSNILTARPFAFEVNVADNAGTVTAGGSVFRRAGEAFQVDVRAVTWQSADDLNGDGVADGHNDTDVNNNANLTDNATATGFSLFSTTLEADLLAPTGGDLAGLESAVSPGDGRIVDNFAAGDGSTGSVYYPEVGAMELSADLTQSQYLSASAANSGKIVGRSGPVGRFVPAYFSFDRGSMGVFCDLALGFHYLSKPIDVSFEVKARNTRGVVTQNYADDFARFGDVLGALNAGAVDAVAGDLSARVTVGVNTAAWSAGTGAIAVPVTVERNASPDGPFLQTSLGLQMSDADGVTWEPDALDLDVDADGSADYLKLGETVLKHGRLVLDDAHGPETARLPVTMEVQYWVGNDWRRNEDDSCSQLDKAGITYPDGPISAPSNLTVDVGSGTTTGQYAVEDADYVGFDGGDAQHFFTAPGAGNTGTFGVDISLQNYPWLRHDWNQDGDHSDPSLPTANIQFGVYRGHDRVLYWREVFD